MLTTNETMQAAISNNENLWSDNQCFIEAPKMRRLYIYNFSDTDWIVEDDKSAYILEKIRSFSELPDGWHFGEGCGAIEQAQMTAAEICLKLSEFKINEIELFPGIHGGITVFGYQGSHIFEIFCNENGLIDIWHEFEGNTIYEEYDVLLNKIIKYLRGQLWNVESWMTKPSKEKLLGFSIPDYSIKSYNDLQAMPFPSHQKMMEGPFFPQNVPENAVVLNADIFPVIIPVLQETHLSYGEFPPTTCLPTAN